MSQRDYGLYSNYYSYIALLGPFVGLNLYYGLVNAYMDYKGEIRKVRSSVLLLSMIGLIITSVIIFLANKTIGLTIPFASIPFLLTHAYGFFLVNYYIQSMNMENRYLAKGVMLAVPNVLQALFAGIAVIISNTFISRAMGATLGIISCGIVAAVLILRVAVPTVNFVYWKYVLRISLPAIIGSVSAMIMQQCDKVMITSMAGAESTAVYALIYNIGYILYAVEQATNGVWQVWLYNTLKDRKYGNITDVQKWYLFIMLFLATGLYMVAPEIIRILSPEIYWQFEYVIPFVIGSYLMLMYTMNMTVIQYEKRTDISSIIVALAAGINILLNYMLIPEFGGISAAYTSVLSYLFIFIVSSLYLGIKKEFYFEANYYIRNAVFVSLMGILFFLVKNTTVARYLLFLCILAVEIMYLVAKRNEVRGLFGERILKTSK